MSDANVQVKMTGKKATLTGTVPTESKKKILERLAKLEPGIYEVDNQLTIEKKRSF